jgi:small subunit ribosomal protein S6
MSHEPPIYDLTLLLSTATADEDRAKIVADVESAISSGGGSIQNRSDWGTRPLPYRIRHQRDADYHLLQFTGPTALLETLSHNLRIADGVLRFRIIKNLPGMPAAPESAPPVVGVAAPAPAASASAES